MELTLCDFVIIEAALSGLAALINCQNHTKDFSAEFLILNRIHSNCEDITEHGLRVIALFNGLLHCIDSATLESDADHVLEI